MELHTKSTRQDLLFNFYLRKHYLSQILYQSRQKKNQNKQEGPKGPVSLN